MIVKLILAGIQPCQFMDAVTTDLVHGRMMRESECVREWELMMH